MNNLILNKYKLIINRQINLKQNNNKKFPFNLLKKIKASIFLLKIESFKNFWVIESLFLLKLIFDKKSYVSYLKKKYKEYDIIISLDVLKKNNHYFLLLWIIFIYPLIKKRNIKLKNKFLLKNSFTFSQNIYTIYPFFPNIYFSWSKKISYLFTYSILNKNNTKLLSKYYNFFF